MMDLRNQTSKRPRKKVKYVLSLDTGRKQIVVEDRITGQKRAGQPLPIKYCFGMSYIQIQDYVVCAGGYSVQLRPTHAFWKIKHDAPCIELSPLPTAKNMFPFCNWLAKQAVITVGGGSVGGALKECNLYSMVTLKWKMLPNLQKPRVRNAASVIGTYLLFTFGGTECRTQHHIQSLDTNKSETKWRILELQLGLLNSLNQLKVVSQSEKQMVLLGGSESIKLVLGFKVNEQDQEDIRNSSKVPTLFVKN